MRVKVLTQVNIKTMVYWDVTPYCLVDRYHCPTVTLWLLVLYKVLVAIYHSTWHHFPKNHNFSKKCFNKYYGRHHTVPSR